MHKDFVVTKDFNELAHQGRTDQCSTGGLVNPTQGLGVAHLGHATPLELEVLRVPAGQASLGDLFHLLGQTLLPGDLREHTASEGGHDRVGDALLAAEVAGVDLLELIVHVPLDPGFLLGEVAGKQAEVLQVRVAAGGLRAFATTNVRDAERAD